MKVLWNQDYDHRNLFGWKGQGQGQQGQMYGAVAGVGAAVWVGAGAWEEVGAWAGVA